MTFTRWPASLHALTPLHELTAQLPAGATLFGAKGYISAPDAAAILEACGVRVVAQPRDNMEPLPWWDECELKMYRHSLETLDSQCEKMGLERLHARTNPGLQLKVHASLVALACNQLN